MVIFRANPGVKDFPDWGSNWKIQILTKLSVMSYNSPLKLVMGLGKKCLTELGHFFIAWVSHLWVWNISPKNPKFFNFFPLVTKKSHRVMSKSTQIKDGSASYLLWVQSKLRMGQGSSL